LGAAGAAVLYEILSQPAKIADINALTQVMAAVKK